MSEQPPYLEKNARELERMRALVEGLTEDQLNARVNETWTVADVLGAYGRMASLPPARVYPGDPESPVTALRADHRGEHLAQIEAALRP